MAGFWSYEYVLELKDAAGKVTKERFAFEQVIPVTEVWGWADGIAAQRKSTLLSMEYLAVVHCPMERPPKKESPEDEPPAIQTPS